MHFTTHCNVSEITFAYFPLVSNTAVATIWSKHTLEPHDDIIQGTFTVHEMSR